MVGNKGLGILVIRLAGLGDMILTLSSIAPIKEKYPDARIIFLSQKEMLEFLRCFDFIDDVVEYKRGREFFKMVKALRKENVDIIINYERAVKKGVISLLIGGDKRIGFKSPILSFFSNFTAIDLRNDIKVHQRMRYLELTRFLGIENYSVLLPFTPTQTAVMRVEEFFKNSYLNENDFIVGLSPVTGFQSKYWYEDRWAEVADYLVREKKARVVITYGPNEKEFETARKVRSLMREESILSFRTDLVEFCALVKKFDLFLCLDSGPFHLAVSQGIPTISLWGRSSLDQWGPPEGRNHIAIHKNIYCSPCDLFYCERRDCMNSITIEDVIGKIEEIIGITKLV